jgi:hypothetical protein
MKKLICEYCKKEIKPLEAHCTLDSKFKGKITHSDSWHAECWKARWEEKMDKKVREYANTILNKAVPLIKSKIEGGDTPIMLN